jgi:hypothetical protein
MVLNGIPSFFFFFRGVTRSDSEPPSNVCSAEQTEFRRNESKFPSLTCSAEFFLLAILTLSEAEYKMNKCGILVFNFHDVGRSKEKRLSRI